jgi:hypothetical protein
MVANLVLLRQGGDPLVCVLVGAFDWSESNCYLPFNLKYVLRVKYMGYLVCHNLCTGVSAVGSTV